ncbi:hypothetical protein CFP56_023166 [Quercus suber]|uniref:Flavin-containing monooxygenase n=1 Tax=Quercus suber TaxID=58331 RepID=A0AAW0M0Z4_QUESU
MQDLLQYWPEQLKCAIKKLCQSSTSGGIRMKSTFNYLLHYSDLYILFSLVYTKFAVIDHLCTVLYKTERWIGSIVLKKGTSFSFRKEVFMANGEDQLLKTDLVILATGFRGDEKLKDIFRVFQTCIPPDVDDWQSFLMAHFNCLALNIEKKNVEIWDEAYSGQYCSRSCIGSIFQLHTTFLQTEPGCILCRRRSHQVADLTKPPPISPSSRPHQAAA